MEISSFLQSFQNPANSAQTSARQSPALFDLKALVPREVTVSYQAQNEKNSSGNSDKPQGKMLALPSAPPAFMNKGQLLDVVV